jgi:uncharacterized SAM-binding protein YcdF (DUF218 family)
LLSRYKGEFFVLLSLLVLILGSLWMGIQFAGTIYRYQDTVQDEQVLPAVDVIVCLAGARGRIEAAGELWLEYWKKHQRGELTKVPFLYFAGTGPQATWNLIEQRMSPEVREVLISELVIVERESVNTYENALFFARHFQQERWESYLLFTSNYHMKRSQFLFQKVMSELPILKGRQPNFGRVETLSFSQSPFLPTEWKRDSYGVRVTLIEFIKWTYYSYVWPKTVP